MNTREWAYRKLIEYIKAAGLTISLPGEILVW
jgi:effector-binding domain-containing protein